MGLLLLIILIILLVGGGGYGYSRYGYGGGIGIGGVLLIILIVYLLFGYSRFDNEAARRRSIRPSARDHIASTGLISFSRGRTSFANRRMPFSLSRWVMKPERPIIERWLKPPTLSWKSMIWRWTLSGLPTNRMPIAIASSTPKDIRRRAFWLAESVTPFSALVRFGPPPFGQVGRGASRKTCGAASGGAVPGMKRECCGADLRLVLRNHSTCSPTRRPSSSVSPT